MKLDSISTDVKAFTLGGALLTLILILDIDDKENAVKKALEEKNNPYNPGLIWQDEHKREYSGVLEFYLEGAEQKIYIDKYPFGSLDGIRIKVLPSSGNSYELLERKPLQNEEDTFRLLEYYAKREHPSLIEERK